MVASAGRVLDSELDWSDLDLHFAALISRIAGTEAPAVRAAAALASRATANGDACVQLSEFAERALSTFQVSLPPVEQWRRLLRDSAVVGAPGEYRPLVLDEKDRLYLYRYWDYEKRVADELIARAVDAENVNESLLRSGLKRFFPDSADSEQKVAAATAVLRRLCVISGGPGTGKTTTLARILALLAEQAAPGKLAIGLAAPTGKAAARVQDAMRPALERLDLDLFTRPSMPAEAVTLHRLLGARPGSVHYRFHRGNPLPLDVLVLDEASMVDLALTAQLVEALPPQARLILLGDKDQLASVEAGAVMGDICRSAGYSQAFARRLASVASVPVGQIRKSRTPASPLSDSIAFLERSYRFGRDSGIATLARLVNEGRGEDALALLKSGQHDDLAWASIAPAELRSRLKEVVARMRPYFEAIRANEPPETILACLNQFRLLCAHRSGRFGVAAINRAIEQLLESEHLVSTRDTWYSGRPIMITRNDYNLRLFNGDIGIALCEPGAGGRLKVFFPDEKGGVRAVAPGRLPEHETVYAMTIHKTQGSEFAQVLIILPSEPSPVMSRELVYTGITRATARVEIWCSEAAFCAAVQRRLVRASGLHEKLWSARGD